MTDYLQGAIILYMIRVKATRQTITRRDATLLYQKASLFMDALEDIMDAQGNYTSEFIEGLKTSVGQVRRGRLKKIDTLTALGRD